MFFTECEPACKRLISNIVLAGGHTAEMLNLLRAMDFSRYSPRVYVAAATDSMSLKRAQVLEEERQQVWCPPFSNTV